MQRRRNRWFRFCCLPRPRQSWFEIHYNDHRIPDGFLKQQLRVQRAILLAVGSCEHVVHLLSLQNCEIPFPPVFHIWLALRLKKNKNCYFKAFGQDMTCFEAGHRPFWSLGSYGWSRQKGRTCRKHAMTDFMSNVKTKSAKTDKTKYTLLKNRLLLSRPFNKSIIKAILLESALQV